MVPRRHFILPLYSFVRARLMAMQASRFERLVREHKDAVYRQMMRVCSAREDAEDALATALMLAYQSVDQLKDDGAFRSWLGTIGRRVCTRMRRNPSIQNVWEYAEERDLLDPEIAPFEMEVLKGCVKEAVEKLPKSYRTIYVACEIEERSIAEVANREAISEAAVKSRLHRARKMVRDQLDHSICAR